MAPPKDDELLTLMLSGELNCMDIADFLDKYFPGGMEVFERWAVARQDKVMYEIFQPDAGADPEAVAIAFASPD